MKTSNEVESKRCFLSYMNDKPIKWYVIANMDLVIVH